MFYQFNHLGSPDYLKLEKDQNFSFPPHLHQCFEIIVIRSGQMKITVDQRAYLLGSGEAMMIFPNQIHALESTESEHVLCIFSPRLVQAYATRVSDKVPKDAKFRPDPYLVEALERLTPACSSAEKKGVLYSLCGQFDRNGSYAAKEADRERLLFKIFSFVEAEFAGDCSLAGLSAAIGYDYSYLSRYFKKTIGVSFNTYVCHYRISHACYLLENTDLPILQCAYDSGFASLRSFNRSFRQALNCTPSQYKKGKVV